MKKRIYEKPFAEVYITEMESLLQNISGTGESGTIDWSAPKLHNRLIDDSNEDFEDITPINNVFSFNGI